MRCTATLRALSMHFACRAVKNQKHGVEKPLLPPRGHPPFQRRRETFWGVRGLDDGSRRDVWDGLGNKTPHASSTVARSSRGLRKVYCRSMAPTCSYLPTKTLGGPVRLVFTNTGAQEKL